MRHNQNNVTMGSVPDPLFDNTIDAPLLNICEAARVLTVSVPTMRRLQQQRRIPFIKVGHSLRFLKSDLVRYLATSRVASIGE